MTRVEFFDQDGRITGFSCSGHSGYAEEGSDIVCAAVSTAVKFAECTINDVLGERAKTRVKEDEARISLTLPAACENEEAVQAVLTGMLSLADLARRGNFSMETAQCMESICSPVVHLD